MAAKATQTKAKAGRRSTASATSPMPTTKPQLTAWLKDASRTGSELAAAEGKFPETDRLIAAHTSALPATLSTLSHSSDKATRSKVAANPNTPPADYVRLGQQFPNEFLVNPVLDLLLLENPKLLGELPEALLLRVLKREVCPADFLVWASGLPDEKLQLAVAMNANAPAEALERLRGSIHAKVRESVSGSASELEGDPEVLFREAVREVLAALSEDDASKAWEKGFIGLPQFHQLNLSARVVFAGNWDEVLVLSEVVSNPSLRGPLLGRFIGLGIQELHIGVTRNPNTPSDVRIELLELLARNTEWRVRSTVAENSNTPAVLLDVLARDNERTVREKVARNLNTSQASLEALSRDEDSRVRCFVARSPSTPFALLETLVSDDDKYVRQAVASSATTPISLLEALAQSEELYSSLAENPNCPVQVLATLAVHPDWHVRRSAATNANTPSDLLAQIARGGSKWDRCCVAGNTSSAASVLEALAKDDEEDVRSCVATNPNTPVSVLEALAKDEREDVRSSVAANPHTPVSVLEALAKDEVERVRGRVAANHRTPVALIEVLSEDRSDDWDGIVRHEVGLNPNTSCALLDELINDSRAYVRVSVAQNPNTPVDTLRVLAKDKDPEVRRAVAQNPKTPLAALEEIIESFFALLDEMERNPFKTPKLARLLGKVPADQRKAVDEDNFLFFPGKDPNKAVLSQSVVGTVLALCGDRPVEPARLARVVGSTEWLVRAAIARHCGTPPNMLKKLAADAHPLVRALAAARIVD